jgi:hypothetical protein
MDPAVVGSPQFGQIFRTTLPGRYAGQPEQVFASPLVYTPGDGVQYVYLATQQNNIYKLNAKTGVIVASRNLHIPFLTSDLDGCVDINPHIGSTATGVIDPSTGTWYLTTKTYIDQNPDGAKGRPNGRYYFHAISTDDLSERPGFPVNPEGVLARNNPERMFTGGIHHQRPALLHSGQYIYAGFASHCVQYNFTGWIMGWDKSSGRQVEMYATEGAGVKNTVPGGGVWMSGGGLASDNRGSMFFSTGNGYASQLSNVPVSGRQPPTSLEEAAVHMTINDDGTLTPVDFFMPWEKPALDGADKDLGTSPLQILPSQFSCGSVQRMGVVTGKSGKTYWIDLDNMGGYQNGPNKLDAVLQVYQNENSVYAGAGVYPLEGGYIYINVIQYQTHVFKFSCDAGRPSFIKVADSPEKNAFILGVGHGTVTSLNDQPGTGLVWTSDVENSNLRIYSAVPQNGQLQLLRSFVIPGTTKFQRPVFGDGRVYHTTNLGYFYGFGSPVNLPLNCSSYDFGTVGLNQTSNYTTVQCTANVNTQITSYDLSGNRNFVLGNATLPVNLQKGQVFSLQAAFTPTQVGPLSSDILVNTTNGVDGYTSSTPIRLRGTGQSVNAILALQPNTISFDGVVLGQPAPAQSMIMLNQGNTNLTISSYGCSTSSETGPFTSIALDNGTLVCGAFTYTRIPSSIAGNSQSTVSISFDPTTSGTYASFVQFGSTGGNKVITVVGVAGTSSKALLEFQSPNGTWVAYDNTTAFDFGDVLENTSRNLVLRLTNVGGSDSGRLSITVSKPPFGVPGIIGARNQIDLGEGINLAPGQSANATLFCSVPKSQINVNSYRGTAQWTMNLGDPSFGKQFIQFKCNAVSEQAPPLYANGTARYRYAGCWKENQPGRQLDTQVYTTDDNTNEKCVKACSDKGYAFAGTQYLRECWCGNTAPTVPAAEADCNFPCTGNINQVCGGNGVDGTGPHISLFHNADIVNTPPTGPIVNPGVAGYTSMGCYTEGSGGRALPVGKNGGNTNSVANCAVACSGYAMFGVEYGAECYCGDKLGTGSVQAPIKECNMVCAGNSSEYCGAGNRLNVYTLARTATSTTSIASSSTSSGAISASTDTPTSTASSASSASPTPTGPTVPPTISNYTYVDCYAEPPNGRALTGKLVATDDMTLDKCQASCVGYTYFAVEYARECFCGNTLSDGSKPATDGRCNMLCAGNKLQYCGGPVGLTLYKLGRNTTSSVAPSATSTAASVSSVASSAPAASISSAAAVSSASTSSSTSKSDSQSSASPASSTLPASDASSSPASTSSSTASSTAASSSASSSTVSSSAPASSATLTSSSGSDDVPTASSASATTPAQSSSVASTASTVSSSSATSSASSAPASSSASTTTSSSLSVAPSPSVKSDWQYLGCANETNPRALPLATYAGNDMTIESCQAFCLSKNLPLAGLEYARECYCGTALQSYSAVGYTGCNMPCAGNAAGSTAICGGSSRLSVYNYTAYTPPMLVPSVNAVKTYKLQGCYTEPNGARALPNYSFSNSTAMTAEYCVSGCQQKGYTWAGMEYGQECWCANALNANSVKVADGQCNMLCPGNKREYCGAGSRLAVYKAT